VSARVATLIERRHGGDRRAAARRLGVEPALVAGLLSGDWCQFSLDAMAALVRSYGVSVRWLLAAPVGAAPTTAAPTTAARAPVRRPCPPAASGIAERRIRAAHVRQGGR
jgi:hypothetical protein